MIPYIVLLSVPFLLYLIRLDDRIRRRIASKWVINSFFLIWLFLLFLRSESVGIDLVQYKTHFVNYSSMQLPALISRSRELGYALLCKLLSLFTDNFRWVMIASAAIAIIPVWFFYKKESDDYLISILLFVNIALFPMYFSGLRQSMAMLFVVPCYYFCKKKKIVPFLIMVALAYLFHQSAITLLLLYPVFHLRIKNKWSVLLIIPIVGIAWYYNASIFSFVLQFVGGVYAERYGKITATGAYAVLLLLVVFLIYTFVIPDKDKLTSDVIGLRNVLILSVFLQVFAGVHTVVMRINYYYLLLLPVLIPKIMMVASERYKQVVRLSKVVIVLFFLAYFFYSAYTDEDILQIYPYAFLWQS